MRRRRALWAAPVLLAVVMVPAGAGPAVADEDRAAVQSHPENYVALGDSYAAGPLIPLQTGVPAGCLRSNRNYPSLVAETLGIPAFQDASCSGATTEHLGGEQQVTLGVNPPQLEALTPDTDLVTLTIGGNDIGFTEIVNECAARSPLAPHGAACRDYYHSDGSDEMAERIAATAPDIGAALTEIGGRSPDARLLLVGYPAILPDTGPGCFPVVPFSPGDVAYLRETEKRLNAMLADRAAAAGVEYVDTYTPTIGHDVCQLPGVKWIEGLVPTALASPVHPNALGMAGMTAVVVQTLTGDAVRASDA